ncbi:MAG: cysteine desulfurase [Fimbriimonadales bacterium]
MREIRTEFPILSRTVRGKPLVYLDNAATTQKPATVIEAEKRFYERENANVHRGVHTLSQIASEQFEQSRELVREFVNARSTSEIIFTKGCTESINLVANSWGIANLKEGDEILLTYLEHHTNIVPWQLIAKRTGATVRALDINDTGDPRYDQLADAVTERTKLIAVTQVSNALGVVVDVKPFVDAARAVGAKILIDGAQAVAHRGVDVRALDADFYAFSAHKMYGPTGVGVLYGKESLLNEMPPYHGGGDMIKSVSFDRTTYADLPFKFEAGTPNIAGVVAFGEAIRLLGRLGLEFIHKHEQSLIAYAVEKLEAETDIQVIGNPKERSGAISFLIACAHPHDVATVLDTEGVAVRSGHHCSMPLMKRLGIHGTTRMSFGIYNTHEEIDIAIAALQRVRDIFE